MHTDMHTHTLFVKQFQETRHAPTAGLWPAVGMPSLKSVLHITIVLLDSWAAQEFSGTMHKFGLTSLVGKRNL